MVPHFADPGTHQSLCEEAGQVVFNVRKVRCHDCLDIIRRRRRERLKQEQAQLEINSILKKRQDKLKRRLIRREENRSQKG